MAVQLQKSPLGLLGAFLLKIGGKNPTGFGSDVTPVVDVYDQYLATSELQVKIDSTAPTLTQSQTSSFTVPAGKAWRLLAAGGFMVFNVADVALIMEGLISIQAPNSAPNGATVYSFVTPQLGVGLRGFGVAFRPPLFLPSGFTVGVTATYSAAVTVAGVRQGNLLIQEFDL